MANDGVETASSPGSPSHDQLKLPCGWVAAQAHVQFNSVQLASGLISVDYSCVGRSRTRNSCRCCVYCCGHRCYAFDIIIILVSVALVALVVVNDVAIVVGAIVVAYC